MKIKQWIELGQKQVTEIKLAGCKGNRPINPATRIHIYWRTVTPKPMPRKVAIAIPKMPARIPGTINELHPFAVAIPHAVVGPPTLALDAKSNSFRSKRKSFPNPRMTTKWTAIWISANMKILGAVFITFHTLPLAPTTAKNTCFAKCVAEQLAYSNTKVNNRSRPVETRILWNFSQLESDPFNKQVRKVNTFNPNFSHPQSIRVVELPGVVTGSCQVGLVSGQPVLSIYKWFDLFATHVTH